MEEDRLKEIRCLSYHQDRLAYSRSYDIYKTKKILGVKHKKNTNFLEVRKIVGSYMGVNIYTSVARRMDPINQDNKYRALAEKLIQLELNDRSKLQEHLKKYTQLNFSMYDLKDKKSQIKRYPMRLSKEKHTESTTQTWNTTPKREKSPTKQLSNLSTKKHQKRQRLVSQKARTT